MVFSEAPVVVLFSLTVLAFFASPARWRHGVLIVSGLLFYWWYASRFLPLILGLILATYFIAGRLGVWVNVAALVGCLGYFKWQGGVGASPALPSQPEVLSSLTVPLGLSFLAFELIHVSVERQRGKIPHLSIASLLAFALYFPCRMAGPIKRYPSFEESVWTSRWSIVQGYQGGVRILKGFVKKVLLADVLELCVPHLSYAASPWLAWGALFAYAFYLYVDFSAYSDIAIGMSQVLGLRVPENFHAPYRSRNIREFWTRWHQSLSSWLGDYLFVPLSRHLARSSRDVQPTQAAVISYVVTFAICGLWHGPALHFLLWGLYHGVLLSLYALYARAERSLAPVRPRSQMAERVGRAASQGGTFLLVTAGWVLFALDPQKGLELARRLMGWER